MTSRAKEVDEHYKTGFPIDFDNSDIYGLGILLWEIGHKKRAFEDDYDPQLLERIMDGTRPDLFLKDTDVLKELPPGYIQLYASCWDTDPNQWPSIDDVVSQLERLMEGLQNTETNWELLESIQAGFTVNKKKSKL